MGATLIVNPGSSSKKFALFDDGQLLVTWHFEHSGSGFTVCTEEQGSRGLCRDITGAEYKRALPIVVEEAVKEEFLAVADQIETVGIRIVAPSTYFTEHRPISDEFMEQLAALEPLAPHHIPEVLREIEAIYEVLPQVRVIGLSDSAFHQTADPTQKLTGVPKEDAARFDIRRFGYHGLSVASVIRQLVRKEGSVPDNVIVCHIGSGVSVTGIKSGQSVGNSMGYTPVSGIMMSSRMADLSGDELAGLIVRKGLKKSELFTYLYNEGGFRGFTGLKDMRLVLDEADKHNQAAHEALLLFSREVKDQIARFAMRMGDINLIVLTGTAAQRNAFVRSLVVGQLPLFHTFVHNDRNEALMNNEGYIHTDDSAVKLLVLKTDEMGEMYRLMQEL